MKKLYKLTPSLHANIWGGNRLREFGKESREDRIGESWELSFVPGEEAKTESGRSIAEVFDRPLWGKNCEGFEFFPVLTKFIDAKEKLSVQVHPSDEYALKNEGQYGKSEMWYVVDADEGAGLYMGLEKPTSAERFSASVLDGTVEGLLSFKRVSAGDVFFIPAGTIHAIGEGVLIYEIQQNSTLTYRLYDYMRTDKCGNQRELHIDKAMKVSKLEPYTPENYEGEPNVIGKCKYFITKKYEIEDTELNLTVTEDSYMALTAVRGSGTVYYYEDGDAHSDIINKGDTCLCPAGAGNLTVKGNLTLITVETPKE